MNKSFKNVIRKWAAILCLGILPIPNLSAQFVEISAEIESFGYRFGDTNAVAKGKRQTVNAVCVTGTNEWFIENDFSQRRHWLFDGTNVVCRTQPPSDAERALLRTVGRTYEPISKIHEQVWPSRDGNPLGDFGVNLPWLAFCSGSYLKREGRIIALPATILRHCPDRYAYTDVTTTFGDELGLPRSIDLFTSKARWLKAHTDWDIEQGFGNRYTEWNKKTAPTLQDGLLVFHYAVLESTNVLGRNFPTKFEFFQSGRPQELDGNWFCQGIGRVKSIRPSTKHPSLK